MNSGENKFWRDRRVFVTGATGMVGSWLVKDLLEAGAKVAVLVRDADPQSELYRSGDFRQTSLVQGEMESYPTLERAMNEYEADTVFHLAAQPIVGAAHRRPLPTFETNIRGTYNLLEACRALPGLVERIVIASSDKAYGEHHHLPYTEEMPLQGRHPYEVSKSCADLIAQSYHQTYGLPLAILRCGNIYGGGDLNWSRIVPYTIRCCLNDERPVIRSDGQYVRDYIYVKDVSRCYMRAAERLSEKKVQGQAFNFSLERPLTVLEIVALLQQLMNCTHLKPDVQNTAVGEIRAQYLNTGKARDLLNWRPEYTLEQGLNETIAWYRSYLGF
ncbi:MAG: GDP-mannose 4,6-dehydratase [Verrucomicrobia bacterium]|nr:GDP-mannose 4,6-dehydratase [Verrucomicrobiota bacterium]MDE3099510.1 GDP-mannose 4,6-dehydratase [Verrucomicrobiota bacterium]